MSSPTSTYPHVLVLAPFGKDSALLSQVLGQTGFSVLTFRTLTELTEAIDEHSGVLLLTEENLHDELIGHLARTLSAQPRWSDLPIIVFTGTGASTVATEMAVRSRASLGNITLLERPLRPVTLISAVKTALAARQRQYQIRDQFNEREAAEQALRRAHDALETKVEERTTALRKLSSRLMRVQDEERRRIARELHDSLGQYLAAAKINLEVLSAEKAGGDQGNGHSRDSHLREAQHLIDRAIRDMRTLSHLLHPPLLDEAGFGSAARWFVEGFGKRSGIVTKLRMPAKLDRLPPEIETALFRVLQESLTNVHRHSGSREVEVRLSVYQSMVTLAIDDTGKGIPREVLEGFGKNGVNLGVGLAGMRERVTELGGRLEIDSNKSGTRLRAIIPIQAPMSASHSRRDHPMFPNASAVESASKRII
jgi:signal transduction histidine kinase